jgi:hypothetical protein
MGAGILRDYIELETEKEARTALSKKEEKAVAQAAAEKVKLAFMEDRKSKMLLDEREKERRASGLAAHPPVSGNNRSSLSPPPTLYMTGSGHTLSGDNPPPYHADADADAQDP